MHREDNSRFLLYIEPKKETKAQAPLYDNVYKVMVSALEKAKRGTGNYSQTGESERFTEGRSYKGVHHTACGQTSDNCDYLLENGMITNSLAPFYLAYYRSSIPDTELRKLRQLMLFYLNKPL